MRVVLVIDGVRWSAELALRVNAQVNGACTCASAASAFPEKPAPSADPTTPPLVLGESSSGSPERAGPCSHRRCRARHGRSSAAAGPTSAPETTSPERSRHCTSAARASRFRPHTEPSACRRRRATRPARSSSRTSGSTQKGVRRRQATTQQPRDVLLQMITESTLELRDHIDDVALLA
jgi:hypothetical protein